MMIQPLLWKLHDHYFVIISLFLICGSTLSSMICLLITLFIISISMPDSLEQSRNRYQADADMQASKPKYGFFSIPPSHTAAKTDFKKTECRKNCDGRVTVEPRNIFSGGPRTGVTKKSYFSVPKSIYHGDPYIKDVVKKPISREERDIFKPAILNKTLSTSTYKYTCENPTPLDPKRNRSNQGKVITKLRNIFTNSGTKIAADNDKKLKRVNCSFETAPGKPKKQQAKSLHDVFIEEPFKTGCPTQDFFCTNIEFFNDQQMRPKKKNKQRATHIIKHESAFRPSCKPRTTLFSSPKHDTSLHNLKSACVQRGKRNTTEVVLADKSKDAFRLPNKRESSKPSPSIAYSKLTLFRKLR